MALYNWVLIKLQIFDRELNEYLQIEFIQYSIFPFDLSIVFFPLDRLTSPYNCLISSMEHQQAYYGVEIHRCIVGQQQYYVYILI